jgi:hypothetical protein
MGAGIKTGSRQNRLTLEAETTHPPDLAGRIFRNEGRSPPALFACPTGPESDRHGAASFFPFTGRPPWRCFPIQSGALFYAASFRLA